MKAARGENLYLKVVGHPIVMIVMVKRMCSDERIAIVHVERIYDSDATIGPASAPAPSNYGELDR